MTRKKSNFIGILSFFIFGVVGCTSATVEALWTGNTGAWNNNGSWSPEVVPEAGSLVVFPAGPAPNYQIAFAGNVPGGNSLAGIQFNDGAPSYVIRFNVYTLSLNAGNDTSFMIKNLSGQSQIFVVGTGTFNLWNGTLETTNVQVINNYGGSTVFNTSASMTNGTINNIGGFTRTVAGTVTMTDVTINNNGDDENAGHQGNFAIGSGIIASGTIINNQADSDGTQGFTKFYDDTSMTYGTIHNIGGKTQLGNTSVGTVTLTNTTITNSPNESLSVGFTEVVGSVSAPGTTITNSSNTSTNRGYTLVSKSLSGAIITNAGGFTLAASAGTLASPVRNKINEDGVPGYLSVQGAGTTWTLNRNTPLGIDINSTTNGFVFFHNNHSQDVSNGVLNLYLDTNSVYNNVTRSLIYKDTGGDESSLTGEFPTVTWYDTNGNPINVGASFNYSPLQTGQTAPAGLPADGGSVIPLLQVTFTYPPTLTGTNQGQVRSFATHNREMSRHLGLANQHIARAVMASSEKNTSSSLYVPFLSMTGNGLQDQVADNLQKFSPHRSGNTGVWMQPFGRLISQGDQGGITGYKSRMSGLLIGGDHKINPRTIVGASLGYALSTSELNGNTGKSQIKNKLFTTFAKYNADSWYVEGILTLNKNKFRSGRVINPTTVATSTHDGIEAIPSLGFGYKTKIAELDLIPYLTTTFLWDQEDSYVENGAGADNLTIKKRIASQLQGEVGVNATKIHNYDFGQVTYGANLGVLVSTPLKKGPITGTVLGTGFGVESNDSSHTYGIAKLSSLFALEENWYVSATLAGEFGTRYQAYEGGITFRKVI